jgi:hypothetical protein
VQKPPGDAAVALHPAGHRANPRTAHFYFRFDKLDFANFKSAFRKSGKPRLALYECTARRLLHAGAVPNEVRWKNLSRYLRVPLPA